MTDTSGPLTVHEYDEWGYCGLDNDPAGSASTRRVLEVIRSYSPCCNIEEVGQGAATGSTQLPSVLVTVGLQDDKVHPLGAFRWMSLLRDRYSALGDKSPASLFLNVRNEGHEGGATVEDQCRDTATEIAFLERELGWPESCDN